MDAYIFFHMKKDLTLMAQMVGITTGKIKDFNLELLSVDRKETIVMTLGAFF